MSEQEKTADLIDRLRSRLQQVEAERDEAHSGITRLLAETGEAGHEERTYGQAIEFVSTHMFVLDSAVESQLAALRAAERRLQQAEGIAEEALSEWDYASQYKGDYLRKKHGDVERIDELRAKLASALGEGRT